VSATCAPGFTFDPTSCQCACDTTQDCGPGRVLDPDTCSCDCHADAAGKPDCGGCPIGSICQASLCTCRRVGG
jgi:hypothetical protein